MKLTFYYPNFQRDIQIWHGGKPWCNQYHPWGWYIYLHEWLIFMGKCICHTWTVWRVFRNSIWLVGPKIATKNQGSVKHSAQKTTNTLLCTGSTVNSNKGNVCTVFQQFVEIWRSIIDPWFKMYKLLYTYMHTYIYIYTLEVQGY